MNERNKERKNATLSPNRRIPKSDSYEKVRSSSGQCNGSVVFRDKPTPYVFRNKKFHVYFCDHSNTANHTKRKMDICVFLMDKIMIWL